MLTPIACSTSESQLIFDDITKERLRVEIADSCDLVQERGGKYLKCEGEGMFACLFVKWGFKLEEIGDMIGKSEAYVSLKIKPILDEMRNKYKVDA